MQLSTIELDDPVQAWALFSVLASLFNGQFVQPSIGKTMNLPDFVLVYPSDISYVGRYA
jgi:hypothetical protein